jgi:uncharacterized protein
VAEVFEGAIRAVKVEFRRHALRLAVCRLGAEEAEPAWAAGGEFSAVVRTPGELSIVCEESAVPAGVKAQKGWGVIELVGPFDFGLTGVLASVLGPLAEAKVPIFAISTFDTDWVLIPGEHIEKAVRTLTAAGHNEV